MRKLREHIRPGASSFTSENGATRPTSDFSLKNEGVPRFCSSKRCWTLSIDKISMISFILLLNSVLGNQEDFHDDPGLDDLLHKTLQNPVLEEDPEDLHDGLLLPASLPHRGTRWRILPGHRTPLAPCEYVGDPHSLGQWSVGQHSRKRPTRGGEVLRATQKSPIIGLDTLPLQTHQATLRRVAVRAGQSPNLC